MSAPTILAAVRDALAQPFVDPVNVGSLMVPRAEARAVERALSTKSELPRQISPLVSAASGLDSPPVQPAPLSPAAALYAAAATFGGAVSPSVADAGPADFFLPFHTDGDSHE